MCRGTKECSGGRRCPSHTNPVLKRLASAVQRVSRWERKVNDAEASGDTQQAKRALELFGNAVRDLEDRSGWDPAWQKVPPASRVDEFTRGRLASMEADDLESAWSQLHYDPRSQAAIEDEWARRDAVDRERTAQEEQQVREIWEATLAPGVVEQISDDDLRAHWAELEDHSDLQERVEAEWDRRAQERWHAPAPSDAEEPADTTAALTGAEVEELDWAYRNLSAAEYREVERRLVTDPSLRTPETAFPERTARQRDRKFRDDYLDYQFERYMDAEAQCRGHLVNKRGRVLGVDPQSLLYGNSKRMAAYASDEFKAFIGATGGHMSFARFAAQRRGGDSRYGAWNAENFEDVARV